MRPRGEPLSVEEQWILLLGAMLASKQTREEAFKRLASDDVPEPFKELWTAVKSEGVETIKAAVERLGVGNGDKTVIGSLIRGLQERSLADFCQRTVRHVEFASGITAEQLLTLLDSMATKIRARKAAMEKP